MNITPKKKLKKLSFAPGAFRNVTEPFDRIIVNLVVLQDKVEICANFQYISRSFQSAVPLVPETKTSPAIPAQAEISQLYSTRDSVSLFIDGKDFEKYQDCINLACQDLIKAIKQDMEKGFEFDAKIEDK